MQYILSKFSSSNVGLSGKRILCRLGRRSLHLGEHFTQGRLAEIELTTPVPLAGRKYLASSNSPNFPEFLAGPRENYPLLVKAINGQGASLTHWAKRSREVIEEAYKQFEKDGTAVAILFRGLPIRHMKDYSEWVNALGYESHPYLGGVTPRSEIEPNVAEGALDPKEMSFEPHSEMAYSPSYPKIFTICCVQKATYGGETAICDVRETLAKLDPHFVEKCVRKNIRYVHFVGHKNRGADNYKSWQHQFLSDDPAEVEAFLREKNYVFEWRGSDSSPDLFFWTIRPPFITDPRNGKQLWFNQLALLHCSYFVESPYLDGVELANKEYAFHTMYGDGEEFERDMVDEHRRITWENSVGFQWKNGDVLFLDQLIVQHSRLSFEGERKVGVSLLTY